MIHWSHHWYTSKENEIIVLERNPHFCVHCNTTHNSQDRKAAYMEQENIEYTCKLKRRILKVFTTKK